MTAPAPTDDELQADAARLEQLLADVRELVPLPVWQRVEDALRSVVRLYAAGLARTLDHARRAGADPDALDHCVVADELLASLLVLHGLHPLTTEQRVRRALAQVRDQLGLGDDGLSLVAITDGVVELAAPHGLATGELAPSLAESIARRAVETAAPELGAVAITGLAPRHDPSLIQLRTARSAP